MSTLNANSNIEGLCGGWLEAKRREDEARKSRIEIENQISVALEKKSEGAITHKLEHYKVTLTQPIYRKLDVEKWTTVKTLIDQKLWPIKVIVEADATGCKWLANNEPQLWALIADAFTVTPGKVGVDVKEIDNE
jgi:hypothetical protein